MLSLNDNDDAANMLADSDYYGHRVTLAFILICGN